MLTADGVVKIGDLGLARLFSDPLQSLFSGDKVVVTIWYRAPELLLGGRHYTPAIDLWAVGCIFAELLALRPIFKGEEAKMDSKKTVPFQRNQFQKVTDILGTPTLDKWPSLSKYPEYPAFQTLKATNPASKGSGLDSWYRSIEFKPKNQNGFQLLSSLLDFNPATRVTAHDALRHPYFSEAPKVNQNNVFQGEKYEYPVRRITVEDIDIKGTTGYGGTKRNAAEVAEGMRPKKKQK